MWLRRCVCVPGAAVKRDAVQMEGDAEVRRGGRHGEEGSTPPATFAHSAQSRTDTAAERARHAPAPTSTMTARFFLGAVVPQARRDAAPASSTHASLVHVPFAESLHSLFSFTDIAHVLPRAQRTHTEDTVSESAPHSPHGCGCAVAAAAHPRNRRLECRFSANSSAHSGRGGGTQRDEMVHTTPPSRPPANRICALGRKSEDAALGGREGCSGSVAQERVAGQLKAERA